MNHDDESFYQTGQIILLTHTSKKYEQEDGKLRTFERKNRGAHRYRFLQLNTAGENS